MRRSYVGCIISICLAASIAPARAQDENDRLGLVLRPRRRGLWERCLTDAKGGQFPRLFKRNLEMELVGRGTPAARAALFAGRHGASLAAVYLFVVVRLMTTRPGSRSGDSILTQAAEVVFSDRSLAGFGAFVAGSSTTAVLGKGILSASLRNASVKTASTAFRYLGAGAFTAGAVVSDGTVNYLDLARDARARQAALQGEAREFFSESTLSLLLQSLDPMRVDYLRVILEGAAVLVTGALTAGANPLLVPTACIGAATAVRIAYDKLKARLFSPGKHRRKLYERLKERFTCAPVPVRDMAPRELARFIVKGLSLHRILLHDYQRGMSEVESGLMDLRAKLLGHFLIVRDIDLGERLRSLRRDVVTREGSFKALRPYYDREPRILHWGFGNGFHPHVTLRSAHLQMRGIPRPHPPGTMHEDRHASAFKNDLTRDTAEALRSVAQGAEPAVSPLLARASFPGPLRLVYVGWQRATIALECLASLRGREEDLTRQWLALPRGRTATPVFREVLEGYQALLERDVVLAATAHEQLEGLLPTGIDVATLDALTVRVYETAFQVYRTGPSEESSDDGILGLGLSSLDALQHQGLD